MSRHTFSLLRRDFFILKTSIKLSLKVKHALPFDNKWLEGIELLFSFLSAFYGKYIVLLKFISIIFLFLRCFSLLFSNLPHKLPWHTCGPFAEHQLTNTKNTTLWIIKVRRHVTVRFLCGNNLNSVYYVTELLICAITY